MNVLFLTLVDCRSIYDHGLYSDLLRQFIEHGDEVYMVSPFDDSKQKECVIEEEHATIVKVPIMRMQKTNLIQKGLSMLTIDTLFRAGIKKHLGHVKFDLILYPTPPITLLGSVRYIQKRDHALAYLLLKDIFPQNAVDIGIMRKSGVKGAVYHFFRNKEKQLYHSSDYIGCMSEANVEYVLSHNPAVDPSKVEVCPNSVEVFDMSVNEELRTSIREKYGIPTEKKVFVFGGNLGKPQGIPFLMECLSACAELVDAYFLIVGDGTEYGKLEKHLKERELSNARLMKRLPKDDYYTMVAACDVGLIFLDHRFTIPNFPSRLISYMQAKLPVLAATDPSTDIGKVIVDGGFGWWCESNDAAAFADRVSKICKSDLAPMKEAAFRYLQEHYSVQGAYATIMKHLIDRERI